MSLRRAFVLPGLLSLAAGFAAPPHVASAQVPTTSPARAATAPVARVERPNGPRLLRVLGGHADRAFAPSSGQIGALVALPQGTTAESLGLSEVAPGIARLRGSAEKILSFADMHPELRVEVAPPLHPLMDRATFWTNARAARAIGADGTGVYVGVADTGLDVTHPEMRDASGKTRVAWMLDLSLKPISTQTALWPHKALEERFALRNDAGQLVAGAVLARDQIDALLANNQKGPTDEIGHGTHVTSIAAASGIKTAYAGIAPRADVVFVRVTRSGSDAIENDDLVRAVEFMFDRADADKKPIAVNLSLGSDFGSHDGRMLWEQAIASHVGRDKPGHVLVAAAGNSGSIVDSPIHQSVHVPRGRTFEVPVHTEGAAEDGQVQIWVALRQGADLKIGLRGPDGEWIAPVSEGEQAGHNQDGYRSGVIYGSAAANDSQIPEGSRSAVVVWAGKWPSGTYAVTFEGEGTAELYLQGIGEAGFGGAHPAYFEHGVREGTINLPATHPDIIGVGATINRPKWVSIGSVEVSLAVPLLDPTGTYEIKGSRDLIDGEVAWFSSAGPTVTGVPKPEISAPGGIVIAAMSSQAVPSNPSSIFSNPSCPQGKDGKDDARCLQVDKTHAVSLGTSMASPMVAGAAALLLQRDPTLTQEQVRALLQGGAHRFRGGAPFSDQSGPGELDAFGALAALERSKNPANVLPIAERSWLALSADHVAADGSRATTVLVELRTEGDAPADFFDLKRLEPIVIVDGERKPTTELVRRGPGVWVYTYTATPGLGGKSATFGATFDGRPIVPYRTVPVATDGWNAAFGPAARGGCAAAPGSMQNASTGGWALAASVALAVALGRRRRVSAPRRA